MCAKCSPCIILLVTRLRNEPIVVGIAEMVMEFSNILAQQATSEAEQELIATITIILGLGMIALSMVHCSCTCLSYSVSCSRNPVSWRKGRRVLWRQNQ